MTVLTEKAGAGSCIIQEGDHYYSRDVVTVDGGAGLAANTVLGKKTVGGHYVTYDPDATDGSEDVAGILIYPAVGTVEATILTRHAQVKSAALVWFDGATTNEKNTGIAALAALGIIAR
jgi:Bacteriophage lambda head decoration protein D